MDKPVAIRPKLKHSSVFLQTVDGVFFQSDKVIFRLKGKSIAQWISALCPYMNGEHTLEELCNGFEPAQREMLTQLVKTLLQRGVLKDEVYEVPDTLPTPVRRQFASQIAYIDHFTDQPQEKFNAFRESRVLLIGSGESLVALSLSLMRNGLHKLFLTPTDNSEGYHQLLEAEASSVRQGGSEVDVSFPNLHSQYEPECLEDYDIIVYCSDNTSLKEVAHLNELCVRSGRPFLSATIFAGQAMLGPFTRTQNDPCWLCAQLRLSPHRDAARDAAFWQELAVGNDEYSNSDGLFNPIARRIGHGLGFELFKILSGALPSETAQGIILQDLEILEATSSKLVQHPLCPVCTHNHPGVALQHLREIIHNERDRELAPDDIRSKHVALFDSNAGVFREFADEHIQQIPLKGTRITLAKTNPLQPNEKSITSYSIDDVNSAYIPTFTRAISTYARDMPDRRCLLLASPEEMIERGHRVVLPDQLTTWSGGISFNHAEPAAWLPAFSALKHAFVYVPAAAVYPDTPLNRLSIFERTSAGTSVGVTFQNTVTAGLLSSLGYVHLQELMRGYARVVQLDIEALASAEPDLAYLVKSAQRFEHPFTCLEVIHASPLSVLLVHTNADSGEGLATFGFGLSGLEAARMALLDFVGGLQMLQSEGHLPETITGFCPGFTPQSNFVFAAPELSRFTAPAVQIQQIEDYLQEIRRDTLFVNTTPADIWNAEALISGTVLLTNIENE